MFRRRTQEPALDRLDRYITEVVRDEVADPTELDRSLAATVSRVKALDTTPAPDALFLQRLLDDLIEPSVPGTVVYRRPLRAPTANGYHAVTPERRSMLGLERRRRSWPVAHLGTALLVVVLLGAVLFAYGTSPPGGPAERTRARDVTMFRGNSAHTGEMTGPGPTGAPEERWRFRPGGAVSSSPAVVDGVVYAGNDRGDVYALDAATGALRWRVTLPGDTSSSPAVVADTVYIGTTGFNGLAVGVYALDATAGAERWRFVTDATTDRPTTGVSSSPTVVDGVVYVGSDNHQVYALDAETGTERWRFDAGSPVRSAPAVVDGVVYVGNDTETVFALDAANGDERWRFAAGAAGAIAVGGGTIYFGNGDGRAVYAVDAVTGHERWRVVTGGAVTSSPAVVDGGVYVGSDDGNLYALDAATGAERWRFQARDAVGSSPAVVDGIVYVGSWDGNLYAIDSASGQARWQQRLSSAVPSSPAVVGGLIYVGAWEGGLVAVGDRSEPTADSHATTRST